jgi:acetamidase/formamidase
VASGDTVILPETIDGHGIDKDEVSVRLGQPDERPIFVTGAKPGAALKVEIVRMTPSRKTGWTRAARGQRWIQNSSSGLPSREKVNA